ncbi:hypothetical protein Clacol_005485 [Clathrus columnatus]|uniref:Uncharacterized protein n=1 Tax=Clathrus columnatus TaxID=1419009 RepID=A0AAV5ACQ9_9AGAM|nr:hypothetical protein Clacol_005485 [Clathrus columnatus]
MGFGRWPPGLRAWIYHPTRNFHRSRNVRQSDSPPSPLLPFTFNLFPTLHAPNNSPSVETYGLDSEDPNLKTYAFQLKWDMLLDSLARDRANPTRVWEAYCDVCSLVGFEKIPLKIHQQTLRKAVPPKERLGSIIVKRLQAERKPSVPHLYESRLQTIIRNIRESGYQPDLDDYHFILAQFSAVGYPDGCNAVFREMVHRQKLQPTYKTYGLCLQAIAHRLILPCPYRYRKDLLDYSSRMCFELLHDMWTRGIHLTSVNFDLTHRIFKETENWAIYEHLLKVGYGIDLANPDRLSLEVQNQTLSSSSSNVSSSTILPIDEASSELPQGFKPIPFETAALNTLIDALGTRGETSRMVVAFEVLTNPLPKTSPTTDIPWPEDDEDEPAFYQSGTTRNCEYPSPKPNTTTFIFLIRHMAKAKEDVFARHYLNLALEIERAENSRLRNELQLSVPLDQIKSPQLATTRAMVLPLHGLGNRMRHRPFLRWIYWVTCQAIQDKQENLKFYSDWRDNHHHHRSSEPLHETSTLEVTNHEDNHDTTMMVPDSTLLEKSDQSKHHQTVVPQLLRIDFDTPAPATAEIELANEDLKRNRKPFRIDLHISLLERDIEDLQELSDRTRVALKRSTHRLKEKLGRRVWNNKDIFLTSKAQRVHLHKREWIKSVGFGTSGVGKAIYIESNSSNPDIPRWMEDDDEDDESSPNVVT